MYFFNKGWILIAALSSCPFEITAFELLSEKLVSYFRNEKLNLIGI
jgi:hypothetical protein